MRLIAAAALLLALTACGSDAKPDGEPTSAERQQQACAEVRKGVDAFNDDDYEGTVAHFKKAIEPATAFAKTSSARNADDLLNAVRYYAGLQPDDYPEAARTSEEFAKYKAITLGQCTDGTPIDEPEDDDTLT